MPLGCAMPCLHRWTPPAHPHHGGLLQPRRAPCPGKPLLPHHDIPGFGQCWGCWGHFPPRVYRFRTPWLGGGLRDTPSPPAGRGCWCSVGVCSSLPALLPPPSAPLSLPPSPSSFLLTLPPNLRIKESPQAALSPATHPPKGLESSIPLSLCSAWSRGKGRWHCHIR